MDVLSDLKNKMAALAQKHAEHYRKLIREEDAGREEFPCGLKPNNFDGLDKFMKQNWIESHCKEVSQVIFRNGVDTLKRTRDGIVKTVSNHRNQPDMEIPGKFIPEVYEILTVIFRNASLNDRLIYFHALADYYYLKFVGRIRNVVKLDAAQILPLAKYEEQIKVFLPIVKLDALNSVSAKVYSSITEKNGHLKHLVLEIYEYFKNPEFLREDCYRILEEQIGPYNSSVKKFEVIPTKDDKNHSRLTIHYEHNHNEWMMKFLLKLNASHDRFALKNAPSETFTREEFVYSTFIPKLKQLGFKDLSTLFPKCYFFRSNDVIALEDVVNKLEDTADFSTTNVAVRQLAKFHVGSLLFEEKFSQVLRRVVRLDVEYEEYFKEFTFTKSQVDLTQLIQNLLDVLLDKCENITIDSTTKQEIVNLFLTTYDDMNKTTVYRKVICHLNLYPSNLIFNDDHTSCYLSNFRSITYSPPVLDLLQLLHTCTSKATRNRSMSTFLREYYEELGKNLGSYGISVNQICGYGSFLESCSFFKSAAVCLALCPIEFLQTAIRDGKRVLNWRDVYEQVMRRNRMGESKIVELVEELCNIMSEENN